jgi:hypothetical protein
MSHLGPGLILIGTITAVNLMVAVTMRRRRKRRGMIQIRHYRRFTRLLGDLVQAVALGFVVYVVVGLVFVALAYGGHFTSQSAASVPLWGSRLAPLVFLYLPWGLWLGAFLIVRPMRRSGRELTAFRFTWR